MFVLHVLHHLLLFLAIISTARSATPPKWATNTLLEARLQGPSYHIRSLLPLSLTSIATRQSGVTFDSCDGPGDCAGDRLCWQLVDGDLLLCSGGSNCICAPRDGRLVFCVEPSDCDAGELCATDGESYPFCYSEDFIRRTRQTVVTSPPGDGYSRDLCRDSSDCKGDRTCLLATDFSQDCGDANLCFCVPPRFTRCCPGEQCISEEVCAENTGAEDGSPFCASRTNVQMDRFMEERTCGTNPTPDPTTTPSTPSPPTPSPPTPSPPTPSPPTPSPPTTSPPTTSPPTTDGPNSEPGGPTFTPGPIVCIAVHLLRHLPDSELVFRKHAWGTVLCDTQTSCATPGHIVVYKDKPMMMSSYCKLVPCVKRVMQVNSPRYRRKQRVPSMTDGLEFTVFSARYETSLEQHIMAVAVKMGL